MFFFFLSSDVYIMRIYVLRSRVSCFADEQFIKIVLA